MKKNHRIFADKNRGFTLIELIIVIIVLGILAAVALPKFLNLKDDAGRASIAGVSGALSGAVQLSHSRYVLDGHAISDTITGNSQVINMSSIAVTMNGFGWPECSLDPAIQTPATSAKKCGDGTISSSKKECDSIWYALLDSDIDVAYYGDHAGGKKNGKSEAEYIASEPGESNICQYTYYPALPNTLLCILYDTNTGSVTRREGSPACDNSDLGN